MGQIVIVDHTNPPSILAITDQQWLDHANQNNQEFGNRQILLKGDGTPSNTNDPAPYGSFYKDNLTGDRYEQVEVDPNANGYNWQLFSGSGTIIVDRAKSIVDVRNCATTLAVGELVIESLTTPLFVDEAVNNTDKRLIIGFCIAKPTTITAEILFKGPITGMSGFTAGMKVYRGLSGELTSNLPTVGYVQALGNCSDGTHIDFSPAVHQTLRA